MWNEMRGAAWVACENGMREWDKPMGCRNGLQQQYIGLGTGGAVRPGCVGGWSDLVTWLHQASQDLQILIDVDKD